MYENGELKIYCNVYLPSISDEIDINRLAYNDKWAIDQINRLKSAIKEIEDYRIKLFEQSQKIRQSTTHKLIELKREKNYSANKIFYYATLYEVYDDFKDTYQTPNKKILEQTKFAGTERHKAITKFKVLQNQYPGAEIKSNLKRG